MVLGLWNKRYRKGYKYVARWGGQRGQNGVGFMEQEIQKRIQICSKMGRTERTECCWFHETRDTEKDTDMQQERRPERARMVLGL